MTQSQGVRVGIHKLSCVGLGKFRLGGGGGELGMGSWGSGIMAFSRWLQGELGGIITFLEWGEMRKGWATMCGAGLSFTNA